MTTRYEGRAGKRLLIHSTSATLMTSKTSEKLRGSVLLCSVVNRTLGRITSARIRYRAETAVAALRDGWACY